MDTAPSDESWEWDWLHLTCPFLDNDPSTALVLIICPMAHGAPSQAALLVTLWDIPKFLGKDQEEISPLPFSGLFQLEPPIHKDTQSGTRALRDKDSTPAGFGSLEGWKEIYRVTMVKILSVLKTNNFYITYYHINSASSFDTDLLAISNKEHPSVMWLYLYFRVFFVASVFLLKD